ncbi:MAG: transcriptional regulatory protein RtcR, partial [Planctomycetota bacterium]
WTRGDAEAAPATASDDNLLEELLGHARVEQLDRFDRVQLAEVVRTCRRHRSLSAAGRELFAASRARRASTNDTDRVRKYLARFDLDFASLGT